jgi:hypothetical protein
LPTTAAQVPLSARRPGGVFKPRSVIRPQGSRNAAVPMPTSPRSRSRRSI